MQALLKHEADVNDKDNDGPTSLYRVAWKQDEAVVDCYWSTRRTSRPWIGQGCTGLLGTDKRKEEQQDSAAAKDGYSMT